MSLFERLRTALADTDTRTRVLGATFALGIMAGLPVPFDGHDNMWNGVVTGLWLGLALLAWASAFAKDFVKLAWFAVFVVSLLAFWRLRVLYPVGMVGAWGAWLFVRHERETHEERRARRTPKPPGLALALLAIVSFSAALAPAARADDLDDLLNKEFPPTANDDFSSPAPSAPAAPAKKKRKADAATGTTTVTPVAPAPAPGVVPPADTARSAPAPTVPAAPRAAGANTSVDSAPAYIPQGAMPLLPPAPNASAPGTVTTPAPPTMAGPKKKKLAPIAPNPEKDAAFKDFPRPNAAAAAPTPEPVVVPKYLEGYKLSDIGSCGSIDQIPWKFRQNRKKTRLLLRDQLRHQSESKFSQWEVHQIMDGDGFVSFVFRRALADGRFESIVVKDSHYNRILDTASGPRVVETQDLRTLINRPALTFYAVDGGTVVFSPSSIGRSALILQTGSKTGRPLPPVFLRGNICDRPDDEENSDTLNRKLTSGTSAAPAATPGATGAK